MESKDYERHSETITIPPAHVVRLCIECADLFLLYVSIVFSKDIFSAIYMEYIKGFCPHLAKGFVPIRYRGYCLCISMHLILIYFQARVFQHMFPYVVTIAYLYRSLLLHNYFNNVCVHDLYYTRSSVLTGSLHINHSCPLPLPPPPFCPYHRYE
jgi:hypothetical protein